MANTAINHDPAATFPGSSTNTAVVKWSGTSGNALLDSGVIIDASNNITGLNNVTATGYLHLTGDEKELRFYEGANYIAIKTNSSLAANYTLTLPLNDGNASEFLQTNGSGVLTWAAAAGTTINSNADNRIITGSGTANTLEGEATLTFGSNALSFDNDHDGNNAINLINDSNTSSASTRLTIQTGGASAGDAVALFHAGGDSYIIGVDNSDSNKFKIAATGGNLGTNDRFVITSAGEITKPNQPCFGRRLSSSVNNVTGNGDGYVVVWEALSSFGYDYGGNCESNNTTFTAPVDGIYWFEAALTMTHVASNHTEGYIRIKTTSSPWLELINYFQPYANETSVNSFTPVNITGTMELNANQGVVVDIKVYGGSKIVDINGSTNIHSRWSGMLVA